MWSSLNIMLEHITIFQYLFLVLTNIEIVTYITCVIKGTHLYLASILLDNIIYIEVFYIEYFLDKSVPRRLE